MNKKVVITGNQGFIGFWVSAFFINFGWKVYGIDNRSSFGERLFDLVNFDERISLQSNFDISSISDIDKFLEKVEPSIIINLGGQAIVPRAFREPFTTFMSNTIGTLSVIDAANRCPSVRAVSCITSDKVYKNNNILKPFQENDPLGGKDIYSLSKSTCERICDVYINSNLARDDLNIQTIRLGNVVGGGDWSVNRLMPDIIRSIRDQHIFKVRYLNATRPFQHVIDVVEGIANISLSAYKNEIDSGEAWNLGPKDNTFEYVSNVLEIFKSEWKDCNLQIQSDSEIYKEDLNLSVDVSKYAKNFHSPHYDSQTSIIKTVDWYKKFYSGKNPIKLVNEEINLIRIKNE